ncbi:MAG: HD domain-containing protein [Desulfobacterales bacterium]
MNPSLEAEPALDPLAAPLKACRRPAAELVQRADRVARSCGVAAGDAARRAAARILEHAGDPVAAAAALLGAARSRGDAPASVETLRREFGPVVAGLAEADPSRFRLESPGDGERRARFEELLAAFAERPRLALLRLAFRLVELEDALYGRRHDGEALARETLALWVPIADRLSLGGLRRRLEDLSFRLLDPAGYEALREKIAPIQEGDERYLAALRRHVQELLESNGIRAEIQTRTKSLHAIRRKMLRTGKNPEEIMDRLGVRIIVETVPECYQVLGLIHTAFTPVPGTFDDYIGRPKDNGYQSLHTVVIPVRELSHKPVEFQIRTRRMHLVAEFGPAAHWLYKNEEAPAEEDPAARRRLGALLDEERHAESLEAFLERLARRVPEGGDRP